jgi:hypothetical protein
MLRNLTVAVVLIVLLGAVIVSAAADWSSAATAEAGWRVTTVREYAPPSTTSVTGYTGGAGSRDSQLDGDYVAYLGLSGEVFLYQISTGTTTQINATADFVKGLRKDGRYVAWLTSAGVWVYDIVSGGPAQLVDTTAGSELCLSSGRLALNGVDGKIHVLDIAASTLNTVGDNPESGLDLNGNYLVWIETVATDSAVSPTDAEIMFHDFSTGQTVNISGSASVSHPIYYGRDYEPQVAANGFAVWTHAAFGFSEVWGYNATPTFPGLAFQVSYFSFGSVHGTRLHSSPLTDGRWVAWNEGSDLWLTDAQAANPAATNQLIAGDGQGTGGVYLGNMAIGGGWLVYYDAPNVWLYDCSTGASEIVGSVAPQELYGLQTDGQRILAEVGSDTDCAVLLFERGSASTTTTTTVAGTGFLPNPDGYQFANLAYSDPAAATSVFTHLFGASLFNSQGAQQSMSPSGKQAYVNVSGIWAGGICFGMSSTSISYFQRHLRTEDIATGVARLWDLATFGVTQSDPSKLPAALKWNLEEYYTAQCSSLVHDTMFDSTHYVQAGTPTTASDLRNLVQAIATRVQSEPVVLCIWGTLSNGKEGGHAIVAYRVDTVAGGNSGTIWIYDCNYPGVSRSVSYDLQAGTWSYPELFSPTTLIAYVPISLVYSVVDSTTPVSYYPGWVYTSTACRIAFRDSLGRVTGKTASGYVSANPQVRLEPFLDGGVGQTTVDRYLVTGSAARQFTLEQVGSQPAYASAYGTGGSYLVSSTGDSGDSVSVSAPYSGTDVSFATPSDSEVFVAAENGEVWATASFEPDLYSTGYIEVASDSDSQGRLAVVGSSEVVIERQGEAVESVSLGDATNTYTLPSLPDAQRVAIDVSSYNASDGTFEVWVDVNGDGIYESTEEVETTDAPSGASGFSDVPASHPYYTAITGMAAAGVIGGYTDGSFGPNNPVMRQQFAKMIVGTLGFPCTEADICSFNDVVDGGPTTLYPDNYIAVAADYGITNGIGGGNFGPYRNITRAQVITMVVRAAQSYTAGLEIPDAAYYSGWGLFRDFNDPTHGSNVQVAEFNGLLNGLQGSGDVATWLYQPATRGEVAQILWKLSQTPGLAG